MKKILLISMLMVVSMSLVLAQETPKTVVLPLLGEKAPSFTAESTNGTLNFPFDYGNKWKVIFSHPADFTPVCSTELLELAALQESFKKMHVALVVVSTDSLETHNQWVKSMESLEYKNKKTDKIKFPLVEDRNLTIAREYGMIHPNTNTTRDVRGVFIIDPQNKIRAMFYYPMNIGRNMDEIERTVLALQTADKNNVLTPADWKAGDDVLVPYQKHSGSEMNADELASQDLYKVSWYMIFKKLP
jgi:peroxiredoxin 2/4